MNSVKTFMPLGGPYEWRTTPGPAERLPRSHEFFANWRGALAALARQFPEARLWFPSYFCGDVTESLTNWGFRISVYEHLPHCESPVWSTLTPEAGDLVVVVNFFGVQADDAWRDWTSHRPEVLFVEDHTHDPGSAWARKSNSDFAIASLRKTLPVPDGAILWSPAGHRVPQPPEAPASCAAALQYAGMVLKAEYLKTGASHHDLYQEMRSYQLRGEEALCRQDAAHISVWTEEFLSRSSWASLRFLREKNVREFLKQFCSAGIRHVEPLFRTWPEGAVPLNPVLVFNHTESREHCRSLLIQNEIYANVYWPVTRWMSPKATDLALRVLTIPLDFRASPREFDRIIKLIFQSQF